MEDIREGEKGQLFATCGHEVEKLEDLREVYTVDYIREIDERGNQCIAVGYGVICPSCYKTKRYFYKYEKCAWNKRNKLEAERNSFT